MKKVKMLESVHASLDGMNQTYFEKDKEYEINDFLLRSFLERGVCEICTPRKKDLVEEKKVIIPEETKEIKKRTRKTKTK